MEKAKSLAVASSKYLNTQVLSHFYTPTCQMMPNLSILTSGGKENCNEKFWAITPHPYWNFLTLIFIYPH